MKRFQYEVTKHSSQEFMKLVYYCTGSGECEFDQIPDAQGKVLGEILNERGSDGWELVHLAFGEGGMVAFWKKEVF
jgi:hypothetical protein